MGRLFRGALSAFFARLFGRDIIAWFDANPWIWWVLIGGIAFVVAAHWVASVAMDAATAAAKHSGRMDRVPEYSTGGAAKADGAEMVFWRSIANSTDSDDFQAYLEEFPSGVFAALARNRIAEIDRRGESGML